MSDDAVPPCPICGTRAPLHTPAAVSPLLKGSGDLDYKIHARSNFCELCEYVFFTPCPEDEHLERVHAEYDRSGNHGSFYYKLQEFYDLFNLDRSVAGGLVVDAGEGEGRFGRYVYPRADVVNLSRSGGAPGVVLPDLMAAADELFISQRLQQWPRPLQMLMQFTRWMRPGSEVWLDVPIQYGGSLRESFEAERSLAGRRGEPGLLATLNVNLSHYSAHALRRLCHRTGLAPLEFARADGILSVRAVRSDIPREERLSPAAAHRALEERRRSSGGSAMGHRCAFKDAPPPPAPGAGETARMLAEIAQRDAELAAVYASKSWRVTRWLRRLAAPVWRADVAALTPAPTLEFDTRLEFAGPRSGAFLPAGFSDPEPWGRWTDGATAVFCCRHAAARAPGLLEVWPRMVWTRPGEGSVRVAVSINGGRRFPIKPQAGAVIVLPLSAKTMTRPQLEVVFHIANPKRRDEAPTEDARRLGIGLEALRLRSGTRTGGGRHEG